MKVILLNDVTRFEAQLENGVVIKNNPGENFKDFRSRVETQVSDDYLDSSEVEVVTNAKLGKKKTTDVINMYESTEGLYKVMVAKLLEKRKASGYPVPDYEELTEEAPVSKGLPSGSPTLTEEAPAASIDIDALIAKHKKEKADAQQHVGKVIEFPDNKTGDPVLAKITGIHVETTRTLAIMFRTSVIELVEGEVTFIGTTKHRRVNSPDITFRDDLTQKLLAAEEAIKAEKQAAKEAERAAKQAEKEAEKEAKRKEREEARAAKLAEKEAEKEAKAAARLEAAAAKRAEKEEAAKAKAEEAERKKFERIAQQLAEKEAKAKAKAEARRKKALEVAQAKFQKAQELYEKAQAAKEEAERLANEG